MSDLPDPYSVVPRKALTSRQRLQMFLDAGGMCAICGGRIDGAREAWDEHMTPLWLGGSNEEWNRKPVHARCARTKTAKEATDRAKVRRVAEKHIGAKRSSRPLPGGKNSPWKKTFAHGWVRRDEE